MGSTQAAEKLVRPDTGVVFVDDLTRTVERVYANALLRPRFAHEVLVQNTVMNHFKYYTDDATLPCLLPRAREAPYELMDFLGLDNIFPATPDNVAAGLPTPASSRGIDRTAALARVAASAAALDGPADPSWRPWQ